MIKSNDERLLTFLADLHAIERQALIQVQPTPRLVGDGVASDLLRDLDDSLRQLGDDEASANLDTYLADMHALETQSTRFLEAARGRAEAPALAAVFEGHLEETLEQRRRLEERIATRGVRVSRAESTALGLGGVDLVTFLAAQPDPPPELAGFAFAFEQLEAGGYALLSRVAARAGDEETVELAEIAHREERAAAAAVAGAWDASLAALGEVDFADDGDAHTNGNGP